MHSRIEEWNVLQKYQMSVRREQKDRMGSKFDNKINEINLHSLKSYRDYIYQEYQTTLIQYSHEQEQLKQLQKKLEVIVKKIEEERNNYSLQHPQLQRKYQELLSEGDSLRIKASKLQKEIFTLTEIGDISVQKLNEERKLNLHLETEISLVKNENEDFMKYLLEMGEKMSQKKDQIKTQINIKDQFRKRSQKIQIIIEDYEDSSLYALKEIEKLDDSIQINSQQIDLKLKVQENYLKYYQELKLVKKEFKSKIQEKKSQVSDQNAQTDQLIDIQEQLSFYAKEKELELSVQKKEIINLREKIDHQKIEREQNLKSLSKIQRYLKQIKVQNQKLECQIQKNLEEDYSIKKVIDRKLEQRQNSNLIKKEIFRDLSNGNPKKKQKIIERQYSTASSGVGFRLDYILESRVN